MFSTAVIVLTTLLFGMGTLAIDKTCVTPNNDSPIENCCDLAFKLKLPNIFSETFSETLNKPKIYKLKNFCDKNCSTVVINGYCDTVTDGGGWLVVQRRTDGSENFDRNWNDYEMGFGSLTGELWYGLRALHCLTRVGQWELRIDFTLSNGTKSYLHYNHFQVGPTTDEYRLNISGFTGITNTDPFVGHPLNGQKFSTYDNDNDGASHRNCALNGHGKATGGWWHNNCFFINPNFKYNGHALYIGNKWYTSSFFEMKIRPKDCKL